MLLGCGPGCRLWLCTEAGPGCVIAILAGAYVHVLVPLRPLRPPLGVFGSGPGCIITTLADGLRPLVSYPAFALISSCAPQLRPWLRLHHPRRSQQFAAAPTCERHPRRDPHTCASLCRLLLQFPKFRHPKQDRSYHNFSLKLSKNSGFRRKNLIKPGDVAMPRHLHITVLFGLTYIPSFRGCTQRHPFP